MLISYMKLISHFQRKLIIRFNFGDYNVYIESRSCMVYELRGIHFIYDNTKEINRKMYSNVKARHKIISKTFRCLRSINVSELLLIYARMVCYSPIELFCV